jgi:hypothetical protein
MTTQTFTGKLAVETCIRCGVAFGIPTDLRSGLLETQADFYCPNGHGQHFADETEAQKLQRELAAAKRREANARTVAQSWRDQAETAEARRRGQKAANTRLRNRIAAGVCPCCHRNFQDLRRHMDGQHPNFAEVSA